MRKLPVWALLFSIPVGLLALNCGPANVDADSNDFAQIVNTDVAAKDVAIGDEVMTKADDLNLDNGATDEWRGRRWGGWGGRWFGGYGGWGRWWGGWGGSYWPWNWSWSYPSWYTNWWY